MLLSKCPYLSKVRFIGVPSRGMAVPVKALPTNLTFAFSLAYVGSDSGPLAGGGSSTGASGSSGSPAGGGMVGSSGGLDGSSFGSGVRGSSERTAKRMVVPFATVVATGVAGSGSPVPAH